MIKFNSPVISENIWNLYFKTREEMTKIYYEDVTPEDDMRINGITEYATSNVYIDKELRGFILEKTLRHELMHIYLWETGQQARVYNEEELCDLISTAAPIICKTVDDIMLKCSNRNKKQQKN